jgi:hypothetical protein
MYGPVVHSPDDARGDLLADIGRFRIPLYRIAARVDRHPTRIGMALNGRLPLTRDLAERIRAAIEEERAAR